MKLKFGVLALALVVAMSAVVGLTATSATAKQPAGLPTAGDGTGANGEAVVGTFTIEKFKKADGVVTAVGTFVGTVDGQAVTSKATAAVDAINGRSLDALPSPDGLVTQQAVCEILDLTLGPLHLDLLGLVVDLDQVHLQITAESGQGNLLGNLLCAVAGLLDNPGGLDLGGLLQQIVNLLNQILGQL